MQNYDDLLTSLQPAQKLLKDASAAAVRMQKNLQKNVDTGNLTEAKKNLATLAEAITQLNSAVEDAQASISGFNIQEYFASGEFTRQLLDACETRNIDVKGEKGVYEMFPFKIRVLGDDERAAEVYMDRKKIPSYRPSYVADTIHASQEKLYSANFKEIQFITELAEAYDVTCLKTNARIGSTQALNKIYKSMVPMARSRKDYDMQAFAFDLARLYEAGQDAWIAKDGRRFTFGTSRDGVSGIRVLSKTGVETYISTLRPMNEDES